MDPFHAACAAVHVHLRAGRLAAEPHGPDGVIASDVIARLPAALDVAQFELGSRRRCRSDRRATSWIPTSPP